MSDEPEETAYYARLVSMYMDLGTETVLGVFVYHSPGKDPETFLKSNEETLVKLKDNRILNKQECELLLDKTTDKQTEKYIVKSYVDIKNFDISLIITLSINLFTEQQLQPPRKGWGNPPRNNDKSIAADLLRLRTIRNVIVGHHSKARLPKWRFDEEWKKVSEILLRLQQQISQGNETIVKERIEAYRLQIHVSPLENKYIEKLRGWQEEVSKAQDQVEDLLKKLEGFDTYFKHKCDRYERYTKLLINGGRFVLLSFLDEQVKKQGKDIRSLLDENKDTLEGGITDSKYLDILFPSKTTSPIDMSSWNVSMLATVILQLFDKSVGWATKWAIKKVDDAFKNYAENALLALDSDTFEDYSSDLKASLAIVSKNLDEDLADQYNQILVDSKRKISEKEFQTYMDELKTQGTQIKKMADIFEETLQKTKDCLRDMITRGIHFKKSHDLELKMITLGNDEEKKILAEEILTDVWHEALDRSIQTDDYAVVKKEVENILKEIKKSNSVKNITIKTACIILQISCSSPSDVLNIISYFDSTEFHEALVNISKELGYYFNTALSVYSFIPIECLMGILNRKGDPAQSEESGIRLPITVSSPAGMLQLRSYFNSEKIANSTNAISDALSKHLHETITVEVCTDMKVFSNVFDEDKTSSDSCSDHSSSESNLTGSNRLQQFDETGESPEERSNKNINEVSTEDSTAENPLRRSTAGNPLEYTGRENAVTASVGKTETDSNIKQGEIDASISADASEGFDDTVLESDTNLGMADADNLESSEYAEFVKKKADYFETKIQRYRNWIKAGLGIHHVKKGADFFFDSAVQEQHTEIINYVKLNKSLSQVSCNQCSLHTLQPDHVQNKNQQCPLGYLNCNCLNPAGKVACPNKVCGVLYDRIIQLHSTTPPVPFWENTNIHKWCTDPWSIAKCFIHKPGYEEKKKAADIDTEGLWLLEKNSKISISPYNIDEIRHGEKIVYRSEEMEMDTATCKSMLSRLFRELLNYMPSPTLKIFELINEEYIVTIEDEGVVHANVIAALNWEVKHLRQKNSPKNRSKLDGTIKLLSVHKDKMEYVTAKRDLQKRLVKHYQDYVIKVPALPIQLEGNQVDIETAYVDPWMTILQEDVSEPTSNELREQEISSFFDVFDMKGKKVKTVYVLGEAGTGKSVFCKSLVQKWCSMYTDEDPYTLYTDEDRKKGCIKKYEYLFFIFLRHHLDKSTIEMMLKSQYGHPVLDQILDIESDKCLILMDGLDEWNPSQQNQPSSQNKSVPLRDFDKDYTVVTTSRPWKIKSLGITTSEIDAKIILRGIKGSTSELLVGNTILLLNKSFGKDKDPYDFIEYLRKCTITEIQHIPILLQQLVCQWYDNSNFTFTSRCVIYSGMLELPFKWLDEKKSRESAVESDVEATPTVNRSHVLGKLEMYDDYKYTLTSASKLAFEIVHNKENSLSFDFKTIKRLQIPDVVIRRCVNVGILSEDKSIGFSSEWQRESSFSFVHKTVQEFLAAMYIATEFQTYIQPESEREDTPSPHRMSKWEGTTPSEHTSQLENTGPPHRVPKWEGTPLSEPISEREDTSSTHHVSMWEGTPPSGREDTTPPHRVLKRKGSPLSQHISELEDTTPPHRVLKRKGSPLSQHFSELEDTTPPHPVEREDTSSTHHVSMWEGTPPSGREDTTPPHRVLKRKGSPLSQHISELEDTTPPHSVLKRKGTPLSGHISQREDITSPYRVSKFHSTPLSKPTLELEDITLPHRVSTRKGSPLSQHISKLEDTTPPHRVSKRMGSQLLQHISELKDTTLPYRVSKRKGTPLTEPISQREDITSPYRVSKFHSTPLSKPTLELEDITLPHRVSTRKGSPLSQHISKLEDTTPPHRVSKRMGSKLLQLISELKDTTLPYRVSKRKGTPLTEPISQREDITSPYRVSKFHSTPLSKPTLELEDITLPHRVSTRKGSPLSQHISKLEDTTPPHRVSKRMGSQLSQHISELKDTTLPYRVSKRKGTPLTEPISQREDITFPDCVPKLESTPLPEPTSEREDTTTPYRVSKREGSPLSEHIAEWKDKSSLRNVSQRNGSTDSEQMSELEDQTPLHLISKREGSLISEPIADLEDTSSPQREVLPISEPVAEWEDTTPPHRVSPPESLPISEHLAGWVDTASSHSASTLEGSPFSEHVSEQEITTYQSSVSKLTDKSLSQTLSKSGITTDAPNAAKLNVTAHSPSVTEWHSSKQSQREAICLQQSPLELKNTFHQQPLSKQNPQHTSLRNWEETAAVQSMSKRKAADMSIMRRNFVQKYFASIGKTEDILELANVFIFLSGLEPSLVTNVSEFSYNIVKDDSLVVEHRSTLKECTFLPDIQKCISSSFFEADLNVKDGKPLIYLGDIFLDDFELDRTNFKSSAVRNIVSDSVRSLTISFSRVCPYKIRGSQCEMCNILTHLSSCHQLTMLRLDDKRQEIIDGHLELVRDILETNKQSLIVVSLDYVLGVNFCRRGKDMFESPMLMIPKMNQLTSLKVYGIRLPHEICEVLTSYLSDSIFLQELSLDIQCVGGDDHTIDMTKHKALQYLEIGDGFIVTDVNNTRFMTIKFKIRCDDLTVIKQLFDVLRSVKLKHVSLWGNYENIVITPYLSTLIESSLNLCVVELDSLTVHDNILMKPSTLVHLNHIELSKVTLFWETWCEFICSLPEIPQTVCVKTLGLKIRGLAQNYDSLYLRHLIVSGRPMSADEEKARDFVKSKKELFNITRDDKYLFEFFTKKENHSF